MSLAGISAVSDVADTKVVVRAAPSTCTTDVPTKFVPVAVSVNAAPPADADDGEMLDSVGAGGGFVTDSVTAFDVPPPGVGLNTVIAGSAPTVATSDASIAAVT